MEKTVSFQDKFRLLAIEGNLEIEQIFTITPIVYGLTPQGFNTPRLANVKQLVENDFIASYGNINLDPQWVPGPIIGRYSQNIR